MARFEKRPRSTGKTGTSGRSSGGEGKRKEKDDKGGRAGYKAKRSFTRNKSLRSKGEGSERPYRDREEKRGRDDEGAAPRRKAAGPREDWKMGGERKPAFKRERPEWREGPFRRGKDEGDRPAREERRERPAGEGRREGPFRRERSEGGARKERPERPYSRERRTEDSERPVRRGKFGDELDSDERKGRSEGEGREAGDRGSRVRRERPAGERRSERPSPRTDRPARRDSGEGRKEGYRRGSTDREEGAPKRVKRGEFEEGRSFRRDEERPAKKKPAGEAPKRKQADGDGLIRLNKYLSNAGVASRREADKLIESGAVSVNGEVITQLGYKIKPGDTVNYGGQSVKGERKVYLLLNKPKDYITTVDDERDRKTVMELIQGACRERVYPVGRLDRNTTGLLLFTNDGELTTKLTHPKFGVKKIYNVTLNKGLKPDDFKKIVEGVELEDGVIKADDLAFVGEGKKEIGIEIHSGRNRVVRRLFEYLGYDVIKLDRVAFAGLTKKELPRGKYRFLTAKEISFLKMIG
jgi:23S rRNA pseudouridine2605 synthase